MSASAKADINAFDRYVAQGRAGDATALSGRFGVCENGVADRMTIPRAMSQIGPQGDVALPAREDIFCAIN
jgi:hypothetical protein